MTAGRPKDLHINLKISICPEEVHAAGPAIFLILSSLDEEKEARVTLYEAWRLAYPSKGGYIVRMPNNMGNAAASQLINDLHSNNWVDGATRAVIIEFAVYNKQTMIFVQTKLFVEFFTTGGAFTYPQFAVCKLASVGTATHLHHQSMALTFRIIVFVFVGVLILQEFRELYQEGVRGYFTSVWNYIDLINYGIFLIQMFYFISYYSFQDEVKDALESGENVYIRGFGSFVVKKRAKKLGRNIKKNEVIEIPAHYIPAFKPSKVFSDQVKLLKVDDEQ